ncbi:MAG: hypothetical protein SFV54_19235 [Bryobacteraceae bacterium]|nr:hypothetical protein [Bryobacteraceae bacterium]
MPPKPRPRLLAATLTLATAAALAHPGSGIVIDARGQVYLTDTGQGVWRFGADKTPRLISSQAFHWMAIDEKGHFAGSTALGEHDGGTFSRITPPGAVPALILSSDYPVTIGSDGALYYVPMSQTGPRELIRRTPDGKRSVFATLPDAAGAKPARWVNGIAAGPDGALYVTDNDTIRKIDKAGTVSTVLHHAKLNDCANPLPGAPGLPYFRGLAVAPDGAIYAAANGCRTVVSVSLKGAVRTVLVAQPPWSPTGVALVGSEVYVLEYTHTSGDDRREWVPRIRSVTSHGEVRTLVTIRRPK